MQKQNIVGKTSLKIIMVLTLIVLTITSCKKDDIQTTDSAYRTIAWNYLGKTQQATVISNWQEAPVEKYTYKNADGTAIEAIVVTFSTNQDALLGPLQVFVDIKSKTAIGIGPRF